MKITIDDAIAELKSDPAFLTAISCVATDAERLDVERQAVAGLRALLEPLLPLVNAVSESPQARQALHAELVRLFGTQPDLPKE